MNNKELNNKFFNDEGKTFAEWKEWVRKAKPTQAEAHVVQATLKNGKKFDRVYGNYVDAQNNAFALKQQLGAKNVKLFKSVNGGPLKLERSFDSSDQFDADEKFFFEVLSRNGKLISRIKAPETISRAIAFRLADQESAKYKKPWAKCRIVNSKGHSFESFNRNFKVNEFVAKNMDSAEEPSLISRIADKYAIDAVFPTSNGFANEKGLLKRDPRKGLKSYEVTFVVKGKDGRPFNTKRSKMAASLEEAKKWAQAESKKYNGVTKIDVKEFKDSADEFANDVMTYPVKSNRNGSKNGYIEKICKTKAEAEALVESLKKKGFIANYKGVRSIDSSDTLDRVREKYCMDENFSKTFESKEKAVDFMNTLNKKYKDKLTGRAFVQALVKPKGSYAVIYFAKSKIGG